MNIKDLTSSQIQAVIDQFEFDRKSAANHFDFASSGSLHNYLKRVFPDIVFRFADKLATATKTVNTKTATVGDTATTDMEPFAATITQLYAIFKDSGNLPDLDKIGAWMKDNQTSQFVLALDAACTPDVLVAFCKRVNGITPRFLAWQEEQELKQASIIRAKIAELTTSGRFVVGLYGQHERVSELADSIVASCATAADEALANKADAAIEHINRAKTDMAKLELDCNNLVKAIRLTLSQSRKARKLARQSLNTMEETLQEVISRLANEVRYTPEQSKLIQAAMTCGMDMQEAVAFLKAKGKL